MSTIQIKGASIQLKASNLQMVATETGPDYLALLLAGDAYVYNSSLGTYGGGVTAIKSTGISGQVGQYFIETTGGILYESAGGSGGTSNNSMYKKLVIDLTGVNSVSISYTRDLFTGSNALIFLLAVPSSIWDVDASTMIPGWPYLPVDDGAYVGYTEVNDMYDYMQGSIVARDYENTASGTLVIDTSARSGNHAILVGVGSDYTTPNYQSFEIEISFDSVVVA